MKKIFLILIKLALLSLFEKINENFLLAKFIFEFCFNGSSSAAAAQGSCWKNPELPDKGEVSRFDFLYLTLSLL